MVKGTGLTEREDFTADEVRAWLREACEEAGGQSYFAKRHGLSAAYVNDVFNGRKDAGAAVAEALGFARVVVYRPLTLAGRAALAERGGADPSPTSPGAQEDRSDG